MVHKISFATPLTVLQYMKKPEKWAIVYMCTRGVDFPSISPICRLNFEPFLAACYYFFSLFYYIYIIIIYSSCHIWSWLIFYSIVSLSFPISKVSTKWILITNPTPPKPRFAFFCNSCLLLPNYLYLCIFNTSQLF